MADKFEHLVNVNFDEKFSASPFIRSMRMYFIRKNTKLYWDLALEHDNVAVLLFHKVKKCFLFVKQFRPAVFVQRVRQMSENISKSLNEIDWSKYPISLGETIELCAGIMDKSNKNPLQTIQEEILEECGYFVDISKIELIKIYLTGIGISGSSQHLFYAEVDESMKKTEGGGLACEGEFIEKVFMNSIDTKNFLNDEILSVNSPPSLLFAVSWFFMNKQSLIS